MKTTIPAIAIILALVAMHGAAASTLTIRPDGQGSYAAWAATGCTAANGYQCVDENPASTADYLSTSSKSVKESFTFGNTGLSTETINSVTLSYYAKYASSTRYKTQPLIRSGGTDYLGNIFSFTASYATYSQTYTTNPATGSAWTPAQIGALEAGMKSYSASYGGVIAQVYAVVDYMRLNSCSDTDGGDVITTQGTTSGYLNDAAYSHTDSCADASNVNEYYCSGTSEQNHQVSCGTDGYTGSSYCLSGDVYRDYVDYSCSSGACGSSTTPTLQQDCVAGQYCSGGACLYNNTCSDTDGGVVFPTMGTVSGYAGGAPYSNPDYCVDSATLHENYCSGSVAYGFDMPCTGNYTGCAAGACY